MGWWSSSEKVAVEANGQVNNNVIQEENINQNSNENYYLLLILCILKAIELLIYIHNKWHSNLKKKYTTKGSQGPV